MREVFQTCTATVLLLLVMFFAGCTSMAERGLLTDVKAHQLPAVDLGPTIILLEEAKLDNESGLASLISNDGHAHLFAIDKKDKIHHIELSGNVVLIHEILGVTKEPASGAMLALDIIEHPQGKLRVVAGDKMFIRSENNQWQEIKGNQCQRFLSAGDDLLCAFTIKGKDIGTPRRTDWVVGWFLLLPIVYWKNVEAEKLVLAKESKEGWAIIAVFDPDRKLSTRDYVVGIDQHGSIHFLYRTYEGSHAFVAHPQIPGLWRDTGPRPIEIRYAQVRYKHMFLNIADAGNHEPTLDKSPRTWFSIQGLPMSPLPFLVGGFETDRRRFFPDLIGPLKRYFAVNRISGDLNGLITEIASPPLDFQLDDGTRKIGASDTPVVKVKIREGKWVPQFDIVTARDLPDSGWRWNDPLHQDALINSDFKGTDHILLKRHKGGFWKSTDEICYLVNSGTGWSAPVVLGNDPNRDKNYTLAVDKTGKVFASWTKGNRVVGRWILPHDTNQK